MKETVDEKRRVLEQLRGSCWIGGDREPGRRQSAAPGVPWVGRVSRRPPGQVQGGAGLGWNLCFRAINSPPAETKRKG